jgi:Fe-S cluster biogenesis protein NfuA
VTDDNHQLDGVRNKLEQLVRDVLAPMVAIDGGTVEWVGLENGIAEIRLGGACAGCPGQHYTAQSVMLPALRAADPSVRSVRIKPML